MKATTPSAVLLALLASSGCSLFAALRPPPAFGPTSDCEQALVNERNTFFLVLDASSRLLTRSAPKVHAGTPLRLCVENIDLRYRINTTVTETALPAGDERGRLGDLLGSASERAAAGPQRVVPPSPAEALRAAVAEAQGAIEDVKKLFSRLDGGHQVPVRDRPALETTLGNALLSFEHVSPAVTKARARLAELQQSPDANEQAALAAAIAAAEGLALARWREAIGAAAAHLEQASLFRFDLTANSDTRAEITVKGTRIALAADADGGLTPSVTSRTEDLARTTVEVRSLSYARVSPGLVLTGVASREFKIAPNEIGAPVITRTEDGALVPAIFLGHYWCPADVREVQPYDRSRWCWGANLLPTLAVGIPLSRNPAENLFLGGLWQPIPGISLVLGRHYGYVARLRSDFVEGSAAPPPPTTFRIEDAVEHGWVYGQYFGVTLSDALFMTLLQQLVK